MALKLVGRSLVATYWDSEEPKLLGELVSGWGSVWKCSSFIVCEAALERDQFSLARSRRKHTTTGLLGKQSVTSLNDLSGVSVIT